MMEESKKGNGRGSEMERKKEHLQNQRIYMKKQRKWGMYEIKLDNI